MGLSVVIITLDAATSLDACLQSASFADELLVVDSGSKDATQDIARQLGARVIEHPWLGFGRQKQFAVDAAANDWVLCLDADERVSEVLRDSIVGTMVAPPNYAYEVARCNRFMGRWLRHGEGYPDWTLRLFHRRHARWSDDPVHEKVQTQQSPARLSGDLLHDSADSLQRYLDKQNRYTSLQARQMHDNGTRFGISALVLSPLLRFLKFYILRLGFLDGVQGLVHITIGCMNSFNKYAKLRELSISMAEKK